jgi:HEAT repeat protein
VTSIDTIESALQHGRTEAAIRAAHELVEGQGNESAHAREIGRMLRDLYANFVVQPVETFYETAISQFPDRLAALMREPVQPAIELTREWAKRLDELAGERLANDIIDRVKSGDMDAAAGSIKAYLGGVAGNSQALTQRSKHVGSLLGGLVHERERASGIVKTISKKAHEYGLDPVTATDMEEEFQRSAIAAIRRERPVAAVARVLLTQATVELTRALPARMALHEPTPEEVGAFDGAVRAITRVCLSSFEQNKFHEATLLFVEFAPKEMSTTGAMAGVEQRAFATLGRTARTIVAKVFPELGAEAKVFDPYLAFARKAASQRVGRYAAEVLGLLRNENAVAFLISAMNDRKLSMRGEAALALGSIGDDRARKALLNALETSAQGKVLEGENRRDAVLMLTALSRSNRTLNPTDRSKLIAHVLKAIPRNDTELVLRVVLMFFTGKVEELSPQLVDWAARVATASLWNIDRPELARAARTQPLGFRQPLINLLERLAPVALDAINDAAMAEAKTFSGAYLALGELYSKIPDPRQLPVLQKLLLNTFLHDDSAPKSAYVKETVLDTATDERADLTKDRVLASLVHAVDRIGGEEAEAILAELFEQTRAGQLPPPGAETADILMQAHMRNAKRRGESVFERKEQSEGAPQTTTSLSEDDMRMLHELEANYLLASKRRTKKVAAMAGLAQRRVVAAIPTVIQHLNDKDPIVASAALTALIDYGMQTPPPVVKRLHEELIQALLGGDNATRVKVANVLMKLGPGRPPLKERLDQLSAREGLPVPVRAVLARLTDPGGAARPGETRANAAAADMAEGNGGDGAPRPAAAAGEKVKPKSALDLKREYILARQEWIRGGKKGPEPVPPK